MKDTYLQWYRIEDKQPEVGEIVLTKDNNADRNKKFHCLRYEGKFVDIEESNSYYFIFPQSDKYDQPDLSFSVTNWAYLPEVEDE